MLDGDVFAFVEGEESKICRTRCGEGEVFYGDVFLKCSVVESSFVVGVCFVEVVVVGF